MAVLAMLGVRAARAEEAPAAATSGRPSRGVFSYTFENDTFFSTERYYTAGNRLAWQSLDGAPAPLAVLGRALSPVLLPNGLVQWGVSISQSIFTSRRGADEDPPRDDRPYAGVLTGSFSLHAMDARSLGTVELALGVIGPGSGAKQVQDGIHELLGKNPSRGWKHQIDDQPAGMLTVERRWRLDRPISDAGLEWGVVPALGVNLGNEQTSAAVGALMRFGRDLAMDFGPPRIRPALSGLGVFHPPDALAWNVFAGIEGRAVAYDATLDSNHHGYWKIDEEPLVGEVPFGFEVAYRRVRFAISNVLQTKTFQSQRAHPFYFSSLSLSIGF